MNLKKILAVAGTVAAFGAVGNVAAQTQTVDAGVPASAVVTYERVGESAMTVTTTPASLNSVGDVDDELLIASIRVLGIDGLGWTIEIDAENGGKLKHESATIYLDKTDGSSGAGGRLDPIILSITAAATDVANFDIAGVNEGKAATPVLLSSPTTINAILGTSYAPATEFAANSFSPNSVSGPHFNFWVKSPIIGSGIPQNNPTGVYSETINFTLAVTPDD